ncbi:histidine phosphatase family protein [Aliidiomarina sp. Khilg15.8]
MAVLYFMRHGQASFGASDYDNLSALGQQQAAYSGRFLREQGVVPNRVISGSMRRQRDTLNTLIESLGTALVPEVDARWNEFDHSDVIDAYAPVYGSTLREALAQNDEREKTFQRYFVGAMTRWVESQHNDDYNESWASFQARVHDQFDALCGDLQLGERVLIVTSGGPISLILQKLLNLDAQTALHLNWRLVNTGITKVAVSSRGAELVSMNEHLHFSGAHRHLLSAR